MIGKRYSFARATLILLLTMAGLAFSQYTVELLPGTSDKINLQCTLTDYSFQSVVVNGQPYAVVSLPNAAVSDERGFPNLPHIAKSIAIPDNAIMAISVVSCQYKDFPAQAPIAPSRGWIPRSRNPNDIPYVFDPIYAKDAWYPQSAADIGAPFYMRDIRGLVVNFSPFAYNPVKKLIRVYSSITVSITPAAGAAPGFAVAKKAATPIDREFANIYARSFMNFAQTAYPPVDESGTMAVFCPTDYIGILSPFVLWKNKRGLKTELIDVGAVGDTTKIKAQILDYFNTKQLKYVLLVGDETKISPLEVKYQDYDDNGKLATFYGVTDNRYGLVKGNDAYYDLFVGRFCGRTQAEIQTQVDRMTHYEQSLNDSDTWLGNAVAGASNDPTKGAFGTDASIADTYFVTQLTKGGYAVTRMYEGGVNKSTVGNESSYVKKFNAGFGVLAYTGHGDTDQLSSISFTTSSVQKLTNANKLPFVLALACLPGLFTYTVRDCLGESLLKYQYNNQPAGAIGCMMSSILQPWDEPYPGVIEMVNLLTDKYSTNIKRTFGGVSTNGIMKTIESYPAAAWVADTWICFGDPSLMVFTKAPVKMTITHPATAALAQTIAVTGPDSATVCLYSAKNGFQSVKTITGGSASFPLTLTTPDTVFVTATKFNCQTYMGVMIAGAATDARCASKGDDFGIIAVRDRMRKCVRLSFTLNNETPVSLQVLNSRGCVVANLLQGAQPSGTHAISWNTEAMPNGMYLFRLETNKGMFTTKKALVLR